MKDTYLNFIEQFNNKSLFEKNSILEEPLFGLKDFLSTEYLNNNYYVDTNIFKEILKELEKINFKYLFLINQYKKYENDLNEQIKILDKEYFELNQTSALGGKFFEMSNLKNHYNFIVPYDVIYKKNLNFTNNKVIKSDENLESIPFTIKEEHGGTFIYFNKNEDIQDIFIDMYNDFQISIFGINTDGTMTNIVANVESSEKLFINTIPEVFKGIFITGIGNITGYIKEIKIYKYVKSSIRKEGILIYKLKELEKINKIFYASNSATKLYKLNTDNYKKLMKIINSGSYRLKEFLNDNPLIEKNKEYSLNETDIVIVEMFEKDINISDKLSVFGGGFNEN